MYHFALILNSIFIFIKPIDIFGNPILNFNWIAFICKSLQLNIIFKNIAIYIVIPGDLLNTYPIIMLTYVFIFFELLNRIKDQIFEFLAFFYHLGIIQNTVFQITTPIFLFSIIQQIMFLKILMYLHLNLNQWFMSYLSLCMEDN